MGQFLKTKEKHRKKKKKTIKINKIEYDVILFLSPQSNIDTENLQIRFSFYYTCFFYILFASLKFFIKIINSKSNYI